jgi:hypothetical protein
MPHMRKTGVSLYLVHEQRCAFRSPIFDPPVPLSVTAESAEAPRVRATVWRRTISCYMSFHDGILPG